MRRTGAFIMFVSVTLGAGCSNASITDPTQKVNVSSPRTSLDDDPNTCRSGYVEINGHIVCNG
jgi:hypothetical protein